MIYEEDNADLNRLPTMEEVRRVVFEVNVDGACGLDGFIGHFYHVYWDNVGKDMFDVVVASFNGLTLPKSITHINLVLISKK